MIDCVKAEQIMSDYILGLTDKEETFDMDAHIHTCEKCRKYYEDLKKADKEMSEKSETEPFKKVNKVIRKQKKNKWIALILAVVFAMALAVIVIGELFPNTGLPSITRLSYKKKAKNIVEDMFNNNMEPMLWGAVNIASGTYGYSETKAVNVKDMFNDYTHQLNSIYDRYLAGRKWSIKETKVAYENRFSYKSLINNGNQNPDHMGYTVTASIGIEDIEFDIIFYFYSPDYYDIYFSYTEDILEYKEGIEKIYNLINHFYRYVLDIDYMQYILNDRMVDNKTVLDDMYDNYVPFLKGVYAPKQGADDITYTDELNEKLKEIKGTSITEHIDMQIRDYNIDKHALNVQMIWQITDINGYKAIMIKNFLYDADGYHPTDDLVEIIAIDGFDAKLFRKLEELF